VCVTSVFVNAQDGGGVNVDEAGVVGLILPSRAEALVRARSSVEENLGLWVRMECRKMVVGLFSLLFHRNEK
jgi:hypothetical protein